MEYDKTDFGGFEMVMMSLCAKANTASFWRLSTHAAILWLCKHLYSSSLIFYGVWRLDICKAHKRNGNSDRLVEGNDVRWNSDTFRS